MRLAALRVSKASSAERSVRVGLARALSKLGYCSRSSAGELVRAGRVRLNGVLRFDPEIPVRLEQDKIEIDGHAVSAAARLYLALNKPRGLVTTTSDEKGRDTVYSCLPGDLSWIAPVGRLDKASEGLLLFTNDPEWAARIQAPETHLLKTYHVQLGIVADQSLLDALQRGVPSEGEVLRAGHARFLRSGGTTSWIEIELDEGKNRHIRRMLQGLGVEVLRLVRVSIGPLVLGDLPKGAVRHLTEKEVQGFGSGTDAAARRKQSVATNRKRAANGRS